jgi:protein phosphatase
MEGMGTTLTLAYVVGSMLYIAHVGDSRLYVLRDGRLRQVTRDHTLVAEMVAKGVIDEATAAHHNLRNVITNTVGGNDRGVQVELRRVELHPGDVLLLCSDGLTEMVDDDDIAKLLQDHPEPEAATQALVEAANEAGGRDNVTAVVARVEAVRLH